MNESFGLAGYVVLIVYMTATVLLGLSFVRKQRNLEGYFLADRATPWWAVGISIIACDLSAISYMGSPAWTYYNDLRYTLSSLMTPFIAVIVAYLFIPFLARLNCYTIYEYLEHRFGLSSRLFSSAVFLLQRAAHMAIAIYAISLALQQIVGWPVWACVAIIGGVTTMYTVLGGMKAVLWTDVMQFFVLIGSIFLMLGVVLWKFDGDVAHIWRVAAEGGHTKILTVTYNFLDPSFWMEMTIWGILLGTLVSLTGAYGSDQVLVQRYIAAGSAHQMAKSLIFSSLLTIPVMMILYLLGLGFFAYYHAPENAALLVSLQELVASTKDENMILPHFVRNVLPSGLAGFVFAGLFAATMSVFSSGLNSLSTVTCIDFVQRLRRRRQNTDQLTLAYAQGVTLVWGLFVTLAAMGVYFANPGALLQVATAVIGFFSGPLLGMFLLGMFSLRANSLGSILGALGGFATAWLTRNDVSFIWYAVTGCLPTIVLGYLLSYLTARPKKNIYPMTVWGRRVSFSLETLDLEETLAPAEQP